jgi:hypothetical protein
MKVSLCVSKYQTKDYCGCSYDSNYGNAVVLYMKLCVTVYKCIGMCCSCTDVHKSADFVEDFETVGTSLTFEGSSTFTNEIPGNWDISLSHTSNNFEADQQVKQ